VKSEVLKVRYLWLIRIIKQQEGAAAVTVALLLIVLVGFVALAIDVGYLMVTRNELQNVADAAALAATRRLGHNYEDMTTDQQLSYTCGTVEYSMPCTEIIAVAIEAGRANLAGQVEIEIRDADVFIGVWDFTNEDASVDSFTAQDANPRAVRVIARRDEQANNPITTFLAGVLGVDTLAVSAVATAALSGQGTAAEGELELPVGIDGQFFVDGGSCGDEIRFRPTPGSCAGWTSFDLNSNTPNMRDLIDGTATNPDLSAGDSFEYSGGQMANLFDDLLLAYKDKGYDVDVNGDPVLTDASGEPVTGALAAADYPDAVPLYDSDGNPLYYPQPPGSPQPLIARNEHVWPSTVLVYEPSNCDNPNQSRVTIGFARIRLTNIYSVPEQTIIGVLDCGAFSDNDTRGGGGAFGTFGTIPGLVQ